VTAIASNRRMMVGDTLIDTGGVRSFNRKVFRCGNGDIVGISGNYATALNFVKWYNGDKDKPQPRGDYECLVLDSYGGLTIWEFGVTMTIKDEFYAIGEGAQACLAAMYLGHTPKTAVQIAKKVNVQVGGRSHIERI